MKNGFSLLMAAVVAAGIVAIGGVGAKAEAQGLTGIGLRVGYNVNEMLIIDEYRWRGHRYYDTTSLFSDYGGHLGLYADVAISEVDMGSGPAVFGITPAIQLSWTGAKTTVRRNQIDASGGGVPDTLEVKLDVDIGALYLEGFIPASFKWDMGGYAVIVELGAFGKVFLLGSDPPSTVVKINDLVTTFDAGIMAGVAVEFGGVFNIGYRITSGFVEENVYGHYVSVGFNIWRN